MKYVAPSTCPVCSHQLVISILSCTNCQSKLEGEFTSCKFCRLPSEQLEFIEVFIKCGGSIKEIEKELGISYPTVKNRLEQVMQSLGYKAENSKIGDNSTEEKQEILKSLEEGKITPKEAAEQLKKITGKSGK